MECTKRILSNGKFYKKACPQCNGIGKRIPVDKIISKGHEFYKCERCGCRWSVYIRSEI